LGREYLAWVSGTALRLRGSPAAAEHMAQTVFLKAFERFDDIGSSPTAAGWLKTVTTNACLNHLSRYRRRWRLFSELGRPARDEPDFEDRLRAEGSVVRDLETAERNSRLERALQALPDHQRVPLVLFHFEQQSYQDIAGLLGVSLGKVKTDMHRGREALRRELTDEHGPDRSRTTG
jgi:RNA polymerase sigma-70 factor (ECF subfamily)